MTGRKFGPNGQNNNNMGLAGSLSPAEWHTRFTVQAGWTQAIRTRLYINSGVQQCQHILEVGCGTGVLTRELPQLTSAQVYGLDLAADFISFAGSHDSQTTYLQGNAFDLPFADRSFDLTFSHFLLLWLHDPLKGLVEMKRVTHPGKAILALAEPDYGGRIDYPLELVETSKYQTLALERQGANPFTGRKLAGLFLQAGLEEVETGVLGGEWRHPAASYDLDSEWTTLDSDLQPYYGPQQIEAYKKIDQAAWQSGERVLFIPTFYAIGWVPQSS